MKTLTPAPAANPVKAPVAPTASTKAIGRAALLKEAEGSEYRMRALLAFFKACDAPAPKGW